MRDFSRIDRLIVRDFYQKCGNPANVLSSGSSDLGSAQFDKSAEVQVFESNGTENLIFATPEWLTKPSNHAKLLSLMELNDGPPTDYHALSTLVTIKWGWVGGIVQGSA